MKKIWQLYPLVDDKIRNKFPEINPIVLQLLINRQISSQQAIDEFLNPDYGSDLHDPFLFIEMEKAVKLVLSSIAEKEKIVVYGDYDADGVCSTAIVAQTLKALGAEFDVYIPFRETEGYGLNTEAAQLLIKNKTDLVITVDCGISNIEEAKILKKAGVKLVITDHHNEPLHLPKADAIINPQLKRENYPFKNLAGCGVAYKFVQGLVSKHKNYSVKKIKEGWEKWLLDLVAIGTITDLMTLLGENRTLVSYGLTVLRKTKRLGLRHLVELMGNQIQNLDEYSIGFQIGPRLNAAGRLNHANSAYQLLITQNSDSAKKLAEELHLTNQQRQNVTDQIIQEATNLIKEPEKKDLLVAVGKGWPTGIVGLVAGRLTDRYYRPSLIISDFGGQLIGSGRSIKYFDITKALQQCDKYLSRYGGHSQAAGFTIKDKDSTQPFIEKMTELADKSLKGKDAVPILEIDAEVKLKEIDWQFFEQLEKFPPFGQNNPKPKFLAKNLNVNDIQTVGAEGKHLRLMVSQDQPIIRKTIGFGFGYWSEKIRRDDKVDLVFEVDINEWNGNRELQLKIIDLKLV